MVLFLASKTLERFSVNLCKRASCSATRVSIGIVATCHRGLHRRRERHIGRTGLGLIEVTIVSESFRLANSAPGPGGNRMWRIGVSFGRADGNPTLVVRRLSSLAQLGSQFADDHPRTARRDDADAFMTIGRQSTRRASCGGSPAPTIWSCQRRDPGPDLHGLSPHGHGIGIGWSNSQLCINCDWFGSARTNLGLRAFSSVQQRNRKRAERDNQNLLPSLLLAFSVAAMKFTIVALALALAFLPCFAPRRPSSFRRRSSVTVNSERLEREITSREYHASLTAPIAISIFPSGPRPQGSDR